jgi:hypothetical protein
VVKSLATDKSPGPDGFNNDFIKKCWSIIAPDFYALCEGFQKGEVCLKCINGSYVTLLPKVDTPSKVDDYSPISLLNCSMKLITKLLANRLQKLITKLVHKNSMVSSNPGLFNTFWLGLLTTYISDTNQKRKSSF